MISWFIAYAVGTSESAAVLVVAMTLAGVWLLRLQHLYLATRRLDRSVELPGIARVALMLSLATIAVERRPGQAVGFCRHRRLGHHREREPVAQHVPRLAPCPSASDRSSRRRVVLVGIDDQNRGLRDLLNDHPELGFTVAGVVGDRLAAEPVGLLDMWIGPSAMPVFATQGQRHPAPSCPRPLDPEGRNATVREFLDSDCHVHVSPGVRGIDHRRLQSVHVGYEPLFYVERADLTRGQVVSKRGASTSPCRRSACCSRCR